MLATREKKIAPTAALSASLTLLLLACSCGPQPQADTRAADETAIRELDAQWSRTAANHDVDGTVAFYSDDAVLLPPNAPIAIGKQAIRDSWAGLLVPGEAVSWQVSKVEVARAGDLAYLIGTYMVISKEAGSSPADAGKLLEVWKKQPDGKWKAVVDTYNSNLPVAAPSAKKK